MDEESRKLIRELMERVGNACLESGLSIEGDAYALGLVAGNGLRNFIATYDQPAEYFIFRIATALSRGFTVGFNGEREPLDADAAVAEVMRILGAE